MKNLLLTACALSISLATMAGLKPGDKATDFKLKNVDNKEVSLSDYLKYDGVILVFTCNECPVAKSYEKRILELDKKYASQGYPVVAINSNDPVMAPGDSFDKMVERAKDKGYSFPYLFDEEQTVGKSYGAAKTPHVYLLTKKKDHFEVSYVGAIDDNQRNPEEVRNAYVEKAIQSLENGKKPETTETLAVGCGIKYRK